MSAISLHQKITASPQPLSSTSIEFLPNELLLRIFSFLKFPSLLSSSFVSKRWYWCVYDTLMHSTSLPSSSSEKTLRRVSSLCTTYRCLQQVDLSMRRFQGGSTHFALLLRQILKKDGHRMTLTVLCLDLTGAHYQSKAYSQLVTLLFKEVSHCAKLTTLQVNSLYLNRPLPSSAEVSPIRFPALTLLKLNGAFLPPLQWEMPSLTALDLYKTTMPEENLFQLLSQNQTSLRLLSLLPNQRPFSKTLVACLENTTALTQLAVHFSTPAILFPPSPAIAEDYAHYFSHGHSALIRLSFSASSYLLNPNVVKAIARQCPCLTHLSLQLEDGLTFSLSSLIENHVLTHLTRLTLVDSRISSRWKLNLNQVSFLGDKYLFPPSLSKGILPVEIPLLAKAFPHTSITLISSH